ncbi:hypothetical protein, partial [Vogesella indigofera]|uniref:hypothetical protein n=1 Tax=Vogesella indigofera TaxID=45465 RepID=UPI00234E88CF
MRWLPLLPNCALNKPDLSLFSGLPESLKVGRKRCGQPFSFLLVVGWLWNQRLADFVMETSFSGVDAGGRLRY